MQRIFMFIFSIGFILYILCAIIAKIEGDFCIMKGRKLESREDIGERLKYKVIISQVEESIKLTQYLQKNSMMIRSLIVTWKKTESFRRIANHLSMCL